MQIVDLIILVAILVLAFSLRIYPVLRKGWYGSDSYSNLLVGRQFRSDRKFPRVYPHMIPKNAHTYPPLFQSMMYPFAWKHEKFALRYLTPIIDSTMIILLFTTADFIGINNAFWPPLIYAISFANLIDSASLNTRPLAYLLMALAMLGTWQFWETGSILVLIAIGVLEGLILIGHKLTTQVLIPLHLIISILLIIGDPVRGVLLLLALPLGFLVADLLTRGRYHSDILPDHIKFIKVHINLGDIRTRKKKLPSPIHLFKSNPIAFLAPFLGIYMILAGLSLISPVIFVTWSLVTFILAQIWIWGDSWRYLQIATFPSALIFVQFIDATSFDEITKTMILLAVALCLTITTILQLKKATERDITKMLKDAMDTISPDWRAKLKDANIYSSPQHFFIPYYTEGNLLIGDPSAKGMRESMKIVELGKTSLREMTDYVKNELGVSIDYYLIFHEFPHPNTDGFSTMYDSEKVSILVSGHEESK